MFAADRLDAMDILRRYSDDHENNQRIVFSVMQVQLKKGKKIEKEKKLRNILER